MTISHFERETTSARGACSADSDLDKWAAAAIDAELGEIATLTQHNINKPGSPFFVSLLKIASVVKGSHASEYETLTAVKRTCSKHEWIPQREIEYQWQRAYKTAVPRHPEVICNYDIKNGRFHSARVLPETTIKKAEQLAAAIGQLLETGELPALPNVTIQHNETDANGMTLTVSFARYSPALADCVQTACSRLRGFVWSDYATGTFRIWVRTKSL